MHWNVCQDEVCMLILSVLQALVGRYYPWWDTSERRSVEDRPCLVCWILGRLLEVLLLRILLAFSFIALSLCKVV